MVKLKAQLKVHYIVLRIYLLCIVGATFISLLVNGIVGLFVAEQDNTIVSPANMLIIALIFMAIVIPLVSYRKLMNLGATRTDYYLGALSFYGLWAVGLSLFNVMWLPFEEQVIRSFVGTLNILEVFHWDQFGYFGSFLYLLAASLLLMSLLHFLFSGLRHVLGWVAWVLLIAAIPIGTSIASLRHHVADGFIQLLFNDHLGQGVALNIALACLFLLGGWLFTKKRGF